MSFYFDYLTEIVTIPDVWLTILCLAAGTFVCRQTYAHEGGTFADLAPELGRRVRPHTADILGP